jgi:hypothetical protein
MNIIDRMRERFTKRQAGASESDPGLFQTPAQMNRATRRRFGWRGPVDPNWVQHESSVFVPRYVRRHHSEASTTRRQRKARARIRRLVAQKGIL